MVVPKWFRKKYPWATKNLEENARKLTSPFDLHETLRAILNQEFVDSNRIYKRGISLFQPISGDRMCEDAGIPINYCNCAPGEKIFELSALSIRAAKFSVMEINKILSNEKNCSPLHLYKPIDARYFSGLSKDPEINIYEVVFTTRPGDALFSSTVQCKKCEYDFKIVGDISRLNSYRNQSECVADPIMELYCHCTNLLK